MTGRFTRLTPGDVGYLDHETALRPMHFVVAIDVAGELTPARLRTLVEERLPLVPELQRVLRYAIRDRGRPVWVDDPTFDISEHISDELEVGSDEQVHAALLLRRLPRDRPLWRMNVRPGTGSTTVYLCVHHAMMDGGLLAGVLLALFPPVPDTSPLPRQSVAPPPSRATLLAMLAASRLRRALQRPRRRPQTEAAGPRALGGAISGARALSSVTVALSDVRNRARAAGVTVNDSFLYALTDALRAGLPALGLVQGTSTLVALVPRDVRGEAEARAVGNRIQRLQIPLPVGEPDAAVRLQTIKAATERAKRGEHSASTGPFDISVSNVRFGGPHAIGQHTVTEYRASAPLRDTRLLAIAVSYLDALTVTITADAELIGEPHALATLVRDALSRDLPQ